MTIATLPKAELHVHLEGTAPPSLVKKIADRNKISLPESLFLNEHEFAWNGFLEFLAAYEAASYCIRVPQDYYDITYDYLRDCAKEGAIYVEMMYSSEHAERASGLPSHEHLLAIGDAIKNARRDFSIEGRILMTCVRHYGVESTIKVAEHAIEARHHFDWIVGFGMGGDETNYPARLFKPAYDLAHAGGLLCTTHAGEVQGPESVWDAIEHLPVSRIGHGVRSIEDPKLIEELLRRDITLEVCPMSNLALSVYPSLEAHPLRKLVDTGLRITLNSDDPPYFHTTLGKEYQIAHEAFGYSEAELLQFTKSAIVASFADEATKKQLLTRITR